MTNPVTIGPLQLDGAARLAQTLAPMLAGGDVLALRGGIGAGKTAFARMLIRALSADPALEVPSPAFSLHQIYETARLRISHFDFYRLKASGETAQLGLEDVLDSDLTIIEWPEHGGADFGADCLEILIEETASDGARLFTLAASGRWQAKLARLKAIFAFLQEGDWADAQMEPLTGDASVRIYYRLRRDGETALLMDWPRQPDGAPIRDGRPYSQIAHLAEGVAPFVAIAAALRHAGLGAPQIYTANLADGLLILEDFGDDAFQRLAGEKPASMPQLWRLAVDGLLQLRRCDPPRDLGAAPQTQPLSAYDAQAMGIETELLLDWFYPDVKKHDPDARTRAEFGDLWRREFAWLAGQQAEIGWVLRDYHSPNLILRENGELGVIDFQDALIGHRAYDLAALLQDARVDVPAALEAELFDYYCAEAAALSPGFDSAGFGRAYATLAAQRATKILGIFVRLNKRDGKPAYLVHLPRIMRYLRRNLEHPELAGLKDWYLRAFPSLAYMAPGSGPGGAVTIDLTRQS